VRRLLIIIAIAAVLAVSAGLAGRTSVPEGHALLIRSRLGGSAEVVGTGPHWALPLLFERHVYPLGGVSDTLAFRPDELRTAESEPVGLDVVIDHEISTEAIPDLDRACRGRYRETLRSAALEILGPLLSGQSAVEVFRTAGESVAGRLAVELPLHPEVAPYTVRRIAVSGVRFDPATERQLVQSLARDGSTGTRIVIVGVDGADWDIIDPMIRRGDLPHFARLIESGTRASLESIQPMLSPRIWTSIATGKTPEVHGITDFMIKDPGSGRVVPLTSNLRHSRALWNILSDLEIPVGFIGWLATWPAESVHGFMVSDRMAYYAFSPDRPLDESPRKTYPEALFDTLRPLVRDQADVGYEEVRRFLDFPRAEYDRHATGGYDPGDPIHNFRLIYATTESYRGIGLRQLREPVRLFALYFELVDAVSHLFVRHMPPRLTEVTDEEYRRFRDAVFETYRYQDEILGQIMAALDEDTILIVLSDHGFRTGAERLTAEPDDTLGPMIMVGHGGRAARAVLDHAPLGILLVRGPGIRRGATIETASVMDIAPTVLYLLGLPAAEDMPGRVLQELVEPGSAGGRPIPRIATYETGEPLHTEAPIASADDRALMEKLAALGYIDPGGSEDPASEGLRLVREGRLEEAIGPLKKAIHADPGTARLRVTLGLAYLKLGRFDDAERELARSLEINPDSPVALSNLAMVLTERADYTAAAEVLERAVALAPQNAELRDNLGVLYFHLERLEDARREFDRAVELEPTLPEPYNNLGAVAMRLGRYEEARTYFEKALALSPGFLRAHLNLGRLALEVDRPADALGYLERVLEIDPENADALVHLGLAQRDLGRLEAARDAWRRAADLDGGGEAGTRARRLLED